MGVTVKVDLSGLKYKLGKDNFWRAKHAMANQVLMDANRLVPKKKGVLRASGHVTRIAHIHYTAPYARRQYYAPPGWEYTTSGTGPKWDEKAAILYSDRWKATFVKGLGLK